MIRYYKCNILNHVQKDARFLEAHDLGNNSTSTPVQLSNVDHSSLLVAVEALVAIGQSKNLPEK